MDLENVSPEIIEAWNNRTEELRKSNEAPKGISGSAAKFVYKVLVERASTNLRPEDIVNEYDLWLCDEWAHVGCCIVVCLENMKLVEGYKKGNKKLSDALVGRTMKFANMTLNAELLQELMPLIINFYWNDK